MYTVYTQIYYVVQRNVYYVSAFVLLLCKVLKKKKLRKFSRIIIFAFSQMERTKLFLQKYYVVTQSSYLSYFFYFFFYHNGYYVYNILYARDLARSQQSVLVALCSVAQKGNDFLVIIIIITLKKYPLD